MARKNRNTATGFASSSLDLGLGALVSAHQDPLKNSGEIQQESAQAFSHETSLDTEMPASSESSHLAAEAELQAAPKVLSVFAALAEEKAWDKLLEYCESQLPTDLSSTSSSEHLEARLWWVAAQLEIGNLPLPILAAPLESAADVLMQQPAQAEFRKLAALILSRLSERAGESSDMSGVLSYIEKAARLDSEYSSSLCQILDAELKQLNTHPLIEQDKKLGIKKQRYEALLKEFQKDVPRAPASRAREVEVLPEEPKAEPIQPLTRTIPYANLAKIALAGIIVVFGIQGIRSQIARLAGLSAEPLVVNLQTQTSQLKASLRLPEVTRVASMSNLDALLYGLNSASQVSAPKGTVAQGSSAPETLGASTEPRIQPEQPSTTENVPAVSGEVKRPVVNTSSPIEGPEFAAIRADIRDGKGEKTPQGAGVPMKRADELFGVSHPREELQAGPARSYAVDKFDSEKTYRIIVRTKVMVRPAFKAPSLAELEEGDKVKVDAQVGPWLKLRSKRGQSGYILAQDAELSERR